MNTETEKTFQNKCLKQINELIDTVEEDLTKARIRQLEIHKQTGKSNPELTLDIWKLVSELKAYKKLKKIITQE